MTYEDAFDDGYTEGVYSAQYARNPHGISVQLVSSGGKLAFKVTNASTLDTSDGYTSLRFEVSGYAYMSLTSKWAKTGQTFGNIDLTAHPPDANGLLFPGDGVVDAATGTPSTAPNVSAGSASTQNSQIFAGMFVLVKPGTNDWGMPYFATTGLVASA